MIVSLLHKMQENVVDRFAAIVATYTEFNAVSWEGVHENKEERRYRELLLDAQEISLRLSRGGICVALWLDRSYEMIVSIMAVILGGFAYVPMNLEAPKVRLSEIMIESSPSSVISLRRHMIEKKEASAAFDDRLIIFADEVLLGIRKVGTKSLRFTKKNHVKPSSPLYVFYTSGTTGKAKGVVVPHCGLVNRVDWLQSRYALIPGIDSVLQKAFYGFGVSEWEIFWPLLHGGRIALAPGGALKDAEYLLQVCARLDVSRLFAVPSQLEALLDIAALSNNTESKVRIIISAGEALSYKLCDSVLKALPSLEKIVNCYGPTEGDMTYYEVGRDISILSTTDTMVPAGYSITNSVVRVVPFQDKDDSRGEIIFYGQGIALGYAPEALAQRVSNGKKFFVDPKLGPGYRTGDLGYFDKNGCLHFIGRADRQVKIRGVRLELGEVETGLRTAGARAACAAVLGSGASARLVAFYTTDSLEEDDTILNRLRTILPPHAIPSTLVFRKTSFPLTANGKLDRNLLLAELRDDELHSNEEWLENESDQLLRAVAEVWRSILGVIPPSADTTFESFGATSLSAGRCVAALRRTLGARVPVTAIFSHNTVRKLAQYLRDHSLVENKTIPRAQIKQDDEKRHLLGLTRIQSDSTKRWCSSFTPYAILCNIFAFYVQSLLDFEAGLPALIEFSVAYTCYSKYSFTMATLVASCTFMSIIVVGFLFAASIKWIILGRAKPGSYAVFSEYYWRWLFATNLFQSAQLVAREIGADTPLVPFVYFLFGAEIGKRCSFDGFLYDADLCQIGDDVQIGHDAVLSGHRISNGVLLLRRFAVGNDCRIKTRAFVACGATVPAETEFGSMATLDSLGLRAGTLKMSSSDRHVNNFNATQQRLRLLFGVPLLAALRQIPMGIAIFALSYCFQSESSDPTDLFQASISMILISAWVYSFVASQVVFGLVVFVKRFSLPLLEIIFWLIARLIYWPPFLKQIFYAHWTEFRYWLETRLVSSAHFEASLGIWINTEVLSCLFRCLGATVGSKVQIDAFYAVDHSAISIGDDVVFGHGVTIETSELELMSPDAFDSDIDDHSASGTTSNILRGSNGFNHTKTKSIPSKCEMVATSQQEQRSSRRRSRHYHPNPCEPLVSPRSNLGGLLGNCFKLLSPPSLSRQMSGNSTSSERRLLSPNKCQLNRRKRVCVIENQAQVLDHCHLEPGVHVREKALLGSTTLVPRDYVVGAATTSMGNVHGNPVILRHASVTPKTLSEIEIVARSRHESFFAWTSFNIWNVGCALALESLQTSVWLMAATFSYQLLPTWGMYILLFPIFDTLLQILETFFVACIKWIFIGKYKPGDHAFYGHYHYQWACMLLLHRSTKPFFEKIRGTCFMNGIFRAFGAHVGIDCCLLNSTVEFDLCRFESRATVGFHAVIQPHTVENLVIKLGPFSMGPSSTIAHLAAIMPDTGLEQNAVLLENSLLPKGCIVQANTVWAGLPAAELDMKTIGKTIINTLTSPIEVASPEEELLLTTDEALPMEDS
mmetsp:Transcript_9180/g.14150  ORF Transcript_9180/g.14150 Transcript_9180/m.14150 type:complete len:1519 (+) Transcript_9180:50-4606(+)